MSTSEDVCCDVCDNKLDYNNQKYLECDGNCGNSFHIKCVGLKVKDYKEIIEEKRSFFCNACTKKKEQRRQTILSTSLTGHGNDERPSVNLESINQKIDMILKKQDKSDDRISMLQKTVNDYKEVVEQLIEDNVEIKNENVKLNNKINMLEINLERFKQQQLDNTIIIDGLKSEKNENLNDIVIELCQALSVNVKNTDIKSTEREYLSQTSKKSGQPPSIVVTMYNKSIKEQLFEAKKGKHLTTEIFNDTDKKPLYVSDALTDLNKFLLSKVKKLRSENKIKYAWVKNGKVLVRKEEGGKTKTISLPSQIDELNH